MSSSKPPPLKHQEHLKNDIVTDVTDEHSELQDGSGETAPVNGKTDSPPKKTPPHRHPHMFTMADKTKKNQRRISRGMTTTEEKHHHPGEGNHETREDPRDGTMGDDPPPHVSLYSLTHTKSGSLEPDFAAPDKDNTVQQGATTANSGSNAKELLGAAPDVPDAVNAFLNGAKVVGGFVKAVVYTIK